MNEFLSFCEKEENLDQVKALLQTDAISRKILLRQTDGGGFNCLHYAASWGNVKCMRYLLTFEELDLSAVDYVGRRTAFDMALLTPYVPYVYDAHGHYFYCSKVPIEIVKILFEVNNNFIHCSTGVDMIFLDFAILWHQFEVVKLLIDLGMDVNHLNASGNTVLHMAAKRVRPDVIRYLLSKTDCDPNVGDSAGWLACCLYVQSLICTHRQLTKERIEFSVEFLLSMYKTPEETVEVYFLLLDCFERKYSDNAGIADEIFMEIVKILLPHNSRKTTVEKILEARLPGDYCLITLILFERIEKSIDNCKLVQAAITRYLGKLEVLKSYFLHELFTLFLADEPLFNEYIGEGIKMEFNGFEIISKFCDTLAKKTSMKKVFNFTKSLLLHGFNIVSMAQPSSSLLLPHMRDPLLNAFVPLSNFVHAPIELMWIFGSKKKDCHFNFNESDNCINDYTQLMKRKSDRYEVVSLKNLSRMSTRKYIFETYASFEALSILYSLNIPNQLRQFLCYNHSNLKF